MFKRFGIASLLIALFLRPALVSAEGMARLEPPPGSAKPAPKDDRTKEVLTDTAIVAALIAASIAAYRAGGPGPCACPEDTDRAGHRCGKRSAHDRPGGWVVQCYATDINAAMIAAERAKRSGK